MADTVIAPFLNKLEYMLLAKENLLYQDEEQLWSLHCLLTRLMPFLMEEKKQSEEFMEHRKKVMEKFVMEVITLVHKAEDVIDSYLNTITRFGLSTDEAHKFRSQIKGMILESNAWFPRLTESGTSSSKRPPIEDDDDDVVLVLEDEMKRMIDLLVKDEDTRRDIIPVVGPRGIGKTTFVRKVYNDPTIVKHFPCRSWICVSNDYKVEELLQDIIEQIKPTIAATAANNSDDDERKELKNLKDLATQTYKHLKISTRYLLVFDDVCETQFWADINMVFPANNKCGSKIIFTTRHNEVASHAKPTWPPFYLRRFSKEESRMLFSKRVSLVDSNHHHHPWEEWVDACCGLPLAIVALAADNKKDDSLNKILPLGICELIYNALPCYLKMCLAYCYVLKEEKGYPFFEYKGLIVAEGLIRPPPPPSVKKIQNQDDQTSSSTTAEVLVKLEDIVEEYLNELINMNLIKVQSRSFDGRIKEITIPQEYYSLSDELFYRSHEIANLRVRSLFDRSMITQLDLERILQDFVSLRALDLIEIKLHYFPRTINMIHLRYLRLHLKMNLGSPEDILVESLSDLWNLHFLKITFVRDRTYERYHRIQLQFWKMQQLRHLLLRGASLDPSFTIEKEVNAIDRRITLLKNLQTLEGLDVEFCVEDVLSMMPNLVTLRLHGETSRSDDDRLACGFPLLERLLKLKLVGFRDPNVCRAWKLEVFPPNITHLTIICTFVREGYLIQALRKLQNLRVLKLGFGSFNITGDGLDFWSDVDGFRQLKFLKLQNTNQSKWKLSVGAMPSLQKVSVIQCWLLQGLPSAALAAIPSLQELEVDESNHRVLRDAKLIEELVGKDRLKLRILPYRPLIQF